MSYEEAIEVLTNRLVDDPQSVPAALHLYLRGGSDWVPPEWGDDEIIREAERDIA